MADYLGNIEVPEIVPSGTFPITPDYPFGTALAPEVYVHHFGSRNAKTEQRFLAGNGAKEFRVSRLGMSDPVRRALRTFWLANQGAYGAFTFNSPNLDGTTTPHTVHFADTSITFEHLLAKVSSVHGVLLREIPDPAAAHNAALLDQVQEIIPLREERSRRHRTTQFLFCQSTYGIGCMFKI
jgi:hypothetical protein